MMPYYQDNHIRIFNKDCRSMDELPDESVQCVVTSPPYWGLRKYAGEQELIWGGDKGCKHQWVNETIKHDALRYRPGEKCIVGSEKNPAIRPGSKVDIGFCSLCGAWKGAYGLEPTPEMYIEHTIEILREIRRVLRKDGVVFWNIGDSYASTPGLSREGSTMVGTTVSQDASKGLPKRDFAGIKPKNLCLIPFRVAISAQMDGWWVRSIIIWNKLNPMPESVNGWRWSRHRIRIDENGNRVTKGGRLVDCPGCEFCLQNDGLWLYKGSWRPTESHEYIIMLTKTDTYYSDAEAVREPAQDWGTRDRTNYRMGTDDPLLKHHGMENINFAESGRNLRSVWAFPTVPFPTFKIDGKEIDHFAVFPEKLPELCIKAATPEVGCCSKCGAPWVRVVKSRFIPQQDVRDPAKLKKGSNKGMALGNTWGETPRGTNETKTIGWRPTCKCNAPRVPSLVLDPLMGAGTTLEEAKKLNRYAVGYDLSQEYCQLTVERCRQQVLL